jgi:hypothetical protein
LKRVDELGAGLNVNDVAAKAIRRKDILNQRRVGGIVLEQQDA